jgi:hypothetical protein
MAIGLSFRCGKRRIRKGFVATLKKNDHGRERVIACIASGN